MHIQDTAASTKQNAAAVTHNIGAQLQRQCACGKHHGNGGECEECRQKHVGLLQRAAVQPSAATERLRLNNQSFATLGGTRVAHDFSQVPVSRAPINLGRQAKNGGGAAGGAAAPAVPDKELMATLFFGNADLKEVLNRRKLLSAGNTGDAVRLVQEALLAEGYELPKFGADGKFGDETAKAVRQFQQRWRMKVDGIVGDQTIGLLDTHLTSKSVLALGETLPLVGGVVKEAAAAALDVAEEDSRKAAGTICPASSKAERMTACIQPVAIANDDGSGVTGIPSLTLAQRIWEKCCVNLSVLSTKVVKKTAYKTLDESPTDVPTAEETSLFTDAGGSSCIQIFVPENFEQGGVIGKNISGGGATYDAGTANPKIVVVEGAVPAVVAHEIGHALGHSTHDAADTVMKPTGAHDVPNSSKVSSSVCAAARTGSALSKTSGKDDCCMFLK